MCRFFALAFLLSLVNVASFGWTQGNQIPIAEATPTAKVPTAQVRTGDAKTALRPLIVRIQLSNSQELRGTLQQTTTLQMKTSFGPITIPLNEVVAIKMAQEGNATTTVALHNGDSVTGAIEIDMFALETEWGKAEVNAPHINSIMFTEGMKWVSETGVNGPRWKLTQVVDKPAAATAPPLPTNAAQRAGVPFPQPFNRQR